MEFTLFYSPTCFYSLMFLKFIETVPVMAKMITCVNSELYDIDGVDVTPTIIDGTKTYEMGKVYQWVLEKFEVLINNKIVTQEDFVKVESEIEKMTHKLNLREHAKVAEKSQSPSVKTKSPKIRKQLGKPSGAVDRTSMMSKTPVAEPESEYDALVQEAYREYIKKGGEVDEMGIPVQPKPKSRDCTPNHFRSLEMQRSDAINACTPPDEQENAPMKRTPVFLGTNVNNTC